VLCDAGCCSWAAAGFHDRSAVPADREAAAPAAVLAGTGAPYARKRRSGRQLRTAVADTSIYASIRRYLSARPSKRLIWPRARAGRHKHTNKQSACACATNQRAMRTDARTRTHVQACTRARAHGHAPAHARARTHTHKPARACTCVYASRRPLSASRGARRRCTPCCGRGRSPGQSRARRAKVLTPGPARPPAVSAARTQAGLNQAAARHACHAAAMHRAGPASHGIRPSAYAPRCLLQARSMPSSAAAV
jgi:hypothetical protein